MLVYPMDWMEEQASQVHWSAPDSLVAGVVYLRQRVHRNTRKALAAYRF
jgi:hypothetical protein